MKNSIAASEVTWFVVQFEQKSFNYYTKLANTAAEKSFQQFFDTLAREKMTTVIRLNNLIEANKFLCEANKLIPFNQNEYKNIINTGSSGTNQAIKNAGIRILLTIRLLEDILYYTINKEYNSVFFEIIEKEEKNYNTQQILIKKI